MKITPEQSKMARSGLGWTVFDLADRTDVHANTIVRFERGEKNATRTGTIDKIFGAFDAAGIEFIPENEAGAGVRFAKPGGDNDEQS